MLEIGIGLRSGGAEASKLLILIPPSERMPRRFTPGVRAVSGRPVPGGSPVPRRTPAPPWLGPWIGVRIIALIAAPGNNSMVPYVPSTLRESSILCRVCLLVRKYVIIAGYRCFS
ncbi:hypothetical protein EJB05_52396, partial [Eragrostis curvula]